MPQLYFLTLVCLVGFAAALENFELFSEKCCSKKNVGGVDYTQIPGNTTDFPACKEGCVYKRDDSPNSRFCFSPGKQPVKCTESVSSVQNVSVTRKNGKISFECPELSHSCELGSAPTESEPYKNITCTHTASGRQPPETAEAAETATLISSLSSDGSLEWISLHTTDLWIHCTFQPFLPSWCYWIPIPGEKNVVFVEGAKPIENQNADVDSQLKECNKRCEESWVAFGNCSFWTLSYHQDQPTAPSTHSHPSARAHRKLSECGLRIYNGVLIETNPDQYIGTFYPFYPFIYYEKGYAAVWKKFNQVSNFWCYLTCYKYSDCTTWTWEFDKNKCSLNNYVPTRKISIGGIRPTPNLYSGCFNRKGLQHCYNLPASAPSE